MAGINIEALLVTRVGHFCSLDGAYLALRFQRPDGSSVDVALPREDLPKLAAALHAAQIELAKRAATTPPAGSA